MLLHVLFPAQVCPTFSHFFCLYCYHQFFYIFVHTILPSLLWRIVNHPASVWVWNIWQTSIKMMWMSESVITFAYFLCYVSNGKLSWRSWTNYERAKYLVLLLTRLVFESVALCSSNRAILALVVILIQSSLYWAGGVVVGSCGGSGGEELVSSYSTLEISLHTNNQKSVIQRSLVWIPPGQDFLCSLPGLPFLCDKMSEK